MITSSTLSTVKSPEKRTLVIYGENDCIVEKTVNETTEEFCKIENEIIKYVSNSTIRRWNLYS